MSKTIILKGAGTKNGVIKDKTLRWVPGRYQADRIRLICKNDNSDYQ
jgi:hypothetical protein